MKNTSAAPPVANTALRRHHPLRWLRLTGLFLLLILIYYAGPRNLLAHLSGAGVGWLLLGFVLNLPQLGLKAWRWHLLVRWQGIRFSYRQSLLAYFGALLIGFLTPGRLGEMAKAFALRHEAGVGLARAFSSVVIDRVFDLYLLVVLGLLGFFRFALIGPVVSRGAFASICLAFFVPLLFLNERVARWSGGVIADFPLLRGRRDWLAAKVDEFAVGLSSLTPARMLVSTALTVVAYAIFFLQCYCCAWALGFTLPVVDLVLIMAVTNVIGFLPFSISNIGTREAGIVFFFTLLRPPLPAALAIGWGLAQFLVLFVGGGLLGFVCWQIAPMGMRLSLGEARRAGRHERV
jgi:uncharacterized protein (TIRG00374 family)